MRLLRRIRALLQSAILAFANRPAGDAVDRQAERIARQEETIERMEYQLRRYRHRVQREKNRAGLLRLQIWRSINGRN